MANFNLNEIHIAGRLTAEPELKRTQGGVSVTVFCVAVSRKYAETNDKGDKERKSDFFNVRAWRERAEMVCQYFHKGASIYVRGELHNYQYTDKSGVVRYGHEILADELRFVDSKAEVVGTSSARDRSAAQETPPIPTPAPVPGTPQFEVLDEDEELPF